MPLSRVQPEQYDALLREKIDVTRALLSPHVTVEPEVFSSPTTGFRMRAEFRVWHEGDALDYVMYRPEDRKTPVPITDFPIACDSIRALMPRLRGRVMASPELRRKLFQVEYLSTLAGDTLVTMVYHRKLDAAWEAAAEALRAELASGLPGLSLIGRSRKQKLVLGRDWVQEALPIDGREWRYRQYEQSFTQPNAQVNIAMIHWAAECAAALDGDLLELYCGNGNFTLPLSTRFGQVIATELAKVSVRAAQENIAENAVENVQVIRLSAEEVTQAMQGVREFRRLASLPKPLPDYDLRTVFVDPPRAGLDGETVKMVAGFERILYISCNPHTLADNLASLTQTHDVERFALFDQFPYTDHMECGVFLRRR